MAQAPSVAALPSVPGVGSARILAFPSNSLAAEEMLFDKETAAAGDSAKVDSTFIDSTSVRRGPGHGWRGARPDVLEESWLGRRLAPATLDRAPENQLREIMEWGFRGDRMAGGSYNTPDPTDWGDLPGREPVCVVLEGFPLAQVGMPEMIPDGVGPFWLSSLTLRPADPLSAPANPSGGALLELRLAEPDSFLATSGARLTQGTNGTYSEEFFLARPSALGLTRVFYGDHRTDGRDIYGAESGQNLLVRFDRGQKWGGWRMSWQQSGEGARVLGRGRLLWNRSATQAGLLCRLADWSADLEAGLDWERLAWDGSPLPASRKAALTRALLRVNGPPGRLRPMLAAQLDLQGQRFKQAPLLFLDRYHRGLSLAIGGEGVSGAWRARGSIGRAAPAVGRSGWVGAFDLRRGWGDRLHWSAHLERSVRAPLLPRLADEFGVLVGQALTVPVVDADRPLEEILRLESSLLLEEAPGAAGPREPGAVRGRRLQLLARLTEIRHATVADRNELQYFQEDTYWSGLFPRDGIDRTVRVASARVDAALPLVHGLAVEAGFTGRLSDPSWEDQLWMTPWEGKGRLSWRRLFFKGDLDVGLSVRGSFSGRRATSQGILGATGRYDAMATAGLGSATFFFLMQNLEDALQAAAAYEAGRWVTLPFRSYRMGLTWRFLD